MKTVFILAVLLTVPVMAHHDKETPLHHESMEMKLLTQKIKEQPDCAALTIRASLYLKAGKKTQAVHDLEHALKLDENYQPARTLLKKLR